MPGTLERPPVLNRRKVGMTSSPHGLYDQGCTRPTMHRTKGSDLARASKSQKNGAQFGLQAATRLHEAGIASNRGSAYRGEWFLSLVHTARQATKVGCARSRCANPLGGKRRR